MSLVGKKFPNLSVDAMNDLGDTFKVNVLEEAVKNNKKVVLFWYPKDFTYVCPTELFAFQDALKDFEAKNTIVIGASVDTAEVHFAWLNTPKDQGGIEGVTYTLLADTNRNLSDQLDINQIGNETYDEASDTYTMDGPYVPWRATYLIDEEGTVFHESVNVEPVGRNVAEYLRMIDAYAHFQKHGEVCPANWEEGKEAILESRDSVAAYLAKRLN
ncbi:peroxiredoxin [Seonamhaeicola maritimus]|uniref:Thioredoxin peroxidase n=1 Tax=Seonamhaeicola maritimus TaxID=2591822 RepID=A0A5C7GNE0_9FLAO|nr:peroxiredoxin [Seonamhaeicola maritimus]TXG39607.1 peroxiredoxin [Seonamhaeicola maritimus]